MLLKRHVTTLLVNLISYSVAAEKVDMERLKKIESCIFSLGSLKASFVGKQSKKSYYIR